MVETHVRFADIHDEMACKAFDRYLTQPLLSYKLQNREIAIIEHGDEPVGYLRLEYLWGKVPYIGLIMVGESWRRQGIGTALLSFVEQHLYSDGHGYLYSSSQVNEAAPQAWHRRVGFVECGIIAGANEGGIGEVFFRKVLTGNH